MFDPAAYGYAGQIHIIDGTAEYTPPADRQIYAIQARGSNAALTALAGNFTSTSGAATDTLTMDVVYYGNFTSITRASGGKIWVYLKPVSTVVGAP